MSNPPSELAPGPSEELPQDSSTLAELMANRRLNLERLQAAGKKPWGQRFERSAMAAEVHRDYAELTSEEQGPEVTMAGRITAYRNQGKASFLNLTDASGTIQLYMRLNDLGDNYLLLKSVDVGDFLGVRGKIFRTRKGELSIHVDEWTPLSKSLRPPPEKWHGLKDAELRYRQRYVDLLSNSKVRATFIQRSHIISEIRRYLDGLGFIEVETPTMTALAGGASARPFTTHHKRP